jgi:hypothetical protein
VSDQSRPPREEHPVDELAVGTVVVWAYTLALTAVLFETVDCAVIVRGHVTAVPAFVRPRDRTVHEFAAGTGPYPSSRPTVRETTCSTFWRSRLCG